MSIDTTTSENNLHYIVKLKKRIWIITYHSAYVLLDMSSTEIGMCRLRDIYVIVCNPIVVNNKKQSKCQLTRECIYQYKSVNYRYIEPES